METINSIILNCWDHGYSSAIYSGGQYLALFIQFFSLVLYRKAYGFPFKRTVLIYVVTYPLLFLWIYLITWVEYGFTSWGSNNIVRVYMWVPLLMLPFSKLLKIPYGKLCDFFAPSFSLSFALGHISCVFAGCCCGYPCSWGIYNPLLHEKLFPIQWVECLGAFIIWLILLAYARKNGYDCRGKVLALFLILTGSTRFIFEFFRNNTKLFFGISELAIWAFLAFVTGCVMMLVICRCSKKSE